MGTLASELGPHAGRIAGQPRLYVDANVPAGLVTYMRTKLQWDVLFVIEHDELRRARDGEHYRLAREWGRTLLTLDRDYLDDRKFPPGDSGGVVVLTAPTDSGYEELLARLDDVLRNDVVLPLEGRKLHLHVDWRGEDESAKSKVQTGK
jgi:predicted nuclease of predicted toxin-antitoxin system